MTDGLDHDFSHGDAGADEEFALAHQSMREAATRIAASNEVVVPDWAQVPLTRWRTRTIDVMNLVESAAHGMAVLENTSLLLEVMFDPATFSPESEADAAHRAREVREMRTSASRAEGEVRRGFPLLHVLGCVWTWASVEALLEDVLVAVLTNDPALADTEQLRDLRIPWAVAAAGDPEALARSVYREVELRRGSTFKGGVTRFEGLLSVVGLGGAVPSDVRKTVFELGQVRNVILHRGGIADRAFVDQCPWMNIAAGTELRISHHRFEEYVFAVMHYVAIVRSRVSDRYSVPEGDQGAIL
jgi:hypothetical protein